MSNATGTGQGSAGNVIAAICSFFIPGLGQLVQGRILAALVMFVLAAVVWFVSFGLLGWLMHLVACIEAARWKRR
jgi:TM2 domain-containing membrane protein YozV